MASSPGSPYNTNRYRKLKRAFIRQTVPFCTYERCPVPDRAIDVRLSGNHPLGPSIDHRVPTSAGGPFWDLSNWALVHRSCNNMKGRKLPSAGEQSAEVIDIWCSKCHKTHPPYRFSFVGVSGICTQTSRDW